MSISSQNIQHVIKYSWSWLFWNGFGIFYWDRILTYLNYSTDAATSESNLHKQKSIKGCQFTWKVILWKSKWVCFVGAISCDYRKRNQRGRRGAKTQRYSQTAMWFQSQSFGSLHSLLPNAPENNPTVFFPRLSGNDLTTARKRNVKHSLELFVTSERWGGPISSASLDIPEHTQPKLPTAGVICCLFPAPKQ